MSRIPELRARFQSRFVNFLLLLLEGLQAAYLQARKLFYDDEARSARLARLSRRLALIEGGRAATAEAVLKGPDAGRAAARKVKIFVNPISGRGVGMKVIPHLQRGLRELGFDVEAVVTERAGQAKQGCWALERNVAAVISVGGDGTLAEIVNGMGDQGVPVALYPTGTANCLAKDLKIPKNPELFCRMVAEAATIGFDVAEWPGRRRFHSFCGVGFDARVVEELSKHRTGPITMSTYAAPILSALKGYDWPAITVEVDGEEITRSAGFVLVSNVRTYAGVMEATPAAALDDGLLDVCIFQTRSWRAMFRYAFGAFTRSHTNDRDVVYVQGKRVHIAADRPGVPVQMDGDNAGHLPVDVQIVPGAVRLIVPAGVARAASAERRGAAAVPLPV